MKTKTRNWLIALFILACPFVLFLGCLFFMEEPLPPVVSLPSPNGYDDLVKAGKMLASNVSDYDKLSQEELRVLVDKNLKALQLARLGMQQECRVSLQFLPGYPNLDDLSGIKRLAHAFVAEGKLAEIDNHPSAAAKSYLAVFHLGNESARGGLLIDQLVEIAMEALGTSRLQKTADQLDAKSCRESAATLETLDSQRQSWETVMQQEDAWSRRTFTGIRYEIARLMRRKALKQSFQKSELAFQQQQIKTRQLMIVLAARAYELDKGHRPASAAELVSEYLKAVPQDPVTGTNLIYSP